MKRYLIVLILIFGSVQLLSGQKEYTNLERGVFQNLDGIDSSGIRGNLKNFSKDKFIDRNFEKKREMQKFLNEDSFQKDIAIVKNSGDTFVNRRAAKKRIEKLLIEKTNYFLNEKYEGIKNNNNVIVGVINSYFDKFIVNNEDNLFIQNRNDSQDLSRFISYNQESEATTTVANEIEFYIDEVKESNIFRLPLNILGNNTINKCEVKFDSSYNLDNKVEKIFVFENNKVHWYRSNKEDVDKPLTELNSMGKIYREKIVVPGVVYLYVPFKFKDHRKYYIRSSKHPLCDNGYTKMAHNSKHCLKVDSKDIPVNQLIVDKCPKDPYNSDTECFHYFNYIKYILSYEINLETGDSSIIVKENKNPFSIKTRKYLMETALFNGEKPGEEESSSRGAHKGYYRDSLDKGFDITTMENDLDIIVSLEDNVIERFDIPNCSSPIVVKLEVKKIIEDFMNEKYRMTLNSIPFKEERCSNTNYEEYNGKCHKINKNITGLPLILDLDNPCESGYAEYENRCVKELCTPGFINDNSGFCRKNINNTKFKDDSLKDYISVGR